MTRLSTLTIAVAIACFTSAGRSVAQDRELPYQQFADAFVERHGLGDVDAFNLRVPDILAKNYLRLGWGQFDVYYPPAALPDRDACDQLIEVLQGLLDLQRRWVDLQEGEHALAAAEAIDTLTKWVRRWNARKLTQAAADGPGDLAARMSPSKKQGDAIASLAGVMRTGRVLGIDRSEPLPSTMVLVPDRRSFLEWMCFLGTFDEENRELFWLPTTVSRAECRVDLPFAMQLVALEYAHPDQSGNDFFMSIEMNSREKNGRLQHVVQNGAAMLTREFFGADIDPGFEGGLVQNLTISVCGENNTRSGGDGKGKSAAAVEVFVPGGSSMGGALAAVNLDSRWREGKGKDYFLRVLRRGQRAAAKRISDEATRHGHFELLNTSQSDSHLVCAPFLGKAAQSQAKIPEEYVDEFKEFHRAYRSGFQRWLETEAGGEPKAAPRLLGSLLRRLAAGSDLEAAALEVYGVPLSAAAPDSPSLEWSFLGWLSSGS